MKKAAVLTAVMLGICGVAAAQTRTVAASGADHTTIADALAFFATDPDPLTANVIQITDSGSYDEAISITVPVTIEGTGASRPTILAQAAVPQATGDTVTDGVVIELPAGGEVTLRNLNIIPSATNTPADDLLRTAGTGGLVLLLEDVTLAPNNGSGAPVSVDGLAPVDLTSAIINGDDGAFIAGTGTAATLRNVVITHFQAPGTGHDGLVCSGAAASYSIEGASVFSYNGRLGIQANGTETFRINSSTTPVKVIGNLGFAGIWFAAAQSVERSIDGCWVLNNGSSTTKSWGIENQNRGTTDMTISNAIIAGNTGEGLLIGSVGTANTTLTNVTIADNGHEPIDISAGSAGTVSATLSIIAGRVGADTPVINNADVGVLTITDSAVVTAGPLALSSATATGTGSSTINALTNADPAFYEIVDFNSPDFYVVSSGAYETIAPGSQPLVGGGGFELALSAEQWNLYQ